MFTIRKYNITRYLDKNYSLYLNPFLCFLILLQSFNICIVNPCLIWRNPEIIRRIIFYINDPKIKALTKVYTILQSLQPWENIIQFYWSREMLYLPDIHRDCYLLKINIEHTMAAYVKLYFSKARFSVCPFFLCYVMHIYYNSVMDIICSNRSTVKQVKTCSAKCGDFIMTIFWVQFKF